MENNVINFMKHFSEGSLNVLTVKEVEIQFRMLSNYSFKESDGELLMECILKYIDCIVNAASNQSFRDQIRICKKSFNVIQDIVSKEVQSTFVRLVTKKVFNIIIEEDIQSWCMKKELLAVFINCIRYSEKAVRLKTVQELPDMYLLKLVDAISAHGDYHLQTMVTEMVFRMYGKNTIQAKLKDLIPESQELCDDFAEINADTFDEDARKFLNSLNKMSGKVFSMICNNISLGNASCQAPMDGIEGLWVDFNMSEKAITWYCSKITVNDNDGEGGNSFEEKGHRTWDLITLFASDVENIRIYRPPMSDDILIHLKLKRPCISSCKNNREVVRRANDLTLVVSRSSRETATLLSRVLTHLFKHKFYRQSAKLFSSKKSTYKALRVSVPTKTSTCLQKCKSDTSSFLSFNEPVAAGPSYSNINTLSRVKSAVPVSPSSTVCEIISIGGSSSVDTVTSLELVPLQRDPIRSDPLRIEGKENLADHPAVVPKTIGANRSGARKKDAPKKRTKFEGASGKAKMRPKKLEVVNPHATLTTMDDVKTRKCHLKPVFVETLESFRKDGGLSFKASIDATVAREKELERQKAKEKRIARTYTKRETRRKVPHMRTEVGGNSDSSDISFNLDKEAEGRDEPEYTCSSPVAEYSTAAPPTLSRGRKKINIISDIQIGQKMASLADDAEVQRKKPKYQDIEAVSSSSQETARIHGDACDVSRIQDIEDYSEINRLAKRQLSNIQEEEQSDRRIATGSAQYKKNSGDHKVFKYAYLMFKSYLDSLEVDDDYHHDAEMICNILEKYK